MKQVVRTIAVLSVGVAIMASPSAVAGVAQVYEMTLNVKTTECKDAGRLLSDACGLCYRFYRAQTSYKFRGLFWGCGSVVIANPIAEQYGRPRLFNWDGVDISFDDNNNSYIFWGSKLAFHQVDFTWELLQGIGDDKDEIEGMFNAQFFACADGEIIEDVSLDVVGTGFGTVESVEDEDWMASILNEITAMSGSLVGVYNIADLAGLVGCTYCGAVVECTPFQLGSGVDIRQNESAVTGTWTLKFNPLLSNLIKQGRRIDEAYKFPSFVMEEFACIEAGDDPPEPTACEKAQANVAAIEKEIKAYQDVVADAWADYYATTTAVNKAYADWQNPKQSALWIAGTNDTDKALKDRLAKKAAFKAMLSAPAYADIATNAAVAAAGTNYWEDAQYYLKAAAQLDAGLRTDTNVVNVAKAKVANDYLALENAVAAVSAGQTVKSALFAALQACYDADEVYFNTAVKYVYLYTYPEDWKDMPDYSTVSAWTTKQLKAVYDEFKADQDKKYKAVAAAQAAWSDTSVRLNAQLGTAQAFERSVCGGIESGDDPAEPSGDPVVRAGDFAAALAAAQKDGVPLVVVWGNTSCGYCSQLVTALDNSEEWAGWQAEHPVHFVVKHEAYESTDADNQAAKTWLKSLNSALSEYPYVGVYWKKTDGTVACSSAFAGRTGKMPVATPKNDLAGQFVASVEALLSGYVTGADRSVFFVVSDTENDRLEAELTTRTVYVPLKRASGDEEESCTLACVYPSGDASNTAVVWAVGEVSKSVAVEISEGVCEVGQSVKLVLLDGVGTTIGGSTVHIVEAQENNPTNPHWLGEYTADTLPYGEWTMDFDVAKQKVAQFGGKLLAMFGGPLWCPNCVTIEDDVFSTEEFKTWARDNQIVLVHFDQGQASSPATPQGTSRGRLLSLTPSTKGKSGASYLSRHGIDPYSQTVQDVIDRVTYLTEAWLAPESTAARLANPVVLLLNDAGTKVDARFQRQSEGYTMDLDENLHRFEDLLLLSGADENEGYCTVTPLMLAAGDATTSSLQVNAARKFYRITGVSQGQSLRIVAQGTDTPTRPLSLVLYGDGAVVASGTSGIETQALSATEAGDLVVGVSAFANGQNTFYGADTTLKISLSVAASPRDWQPGESFLVTFDLGRQDVRVGNGDLAQVVSAGGAAVAPEFSVDADDVEFCGWSAPITNITGSVVVQAQYKIGGVLPEGDGYTEEIDGYVWRFSIWNGEAEIGNGEWGGGVSPMPTGVLTIPDTLGGYPVTRIGYAAFADFQAVTDVVWPPCLQSIGSKAFSYCFNVGEGLSLRLPNSLSAIEDDAFYNCWMREVLVGAEVCDLSPCAFDACFNLKAVYVSPANVEYCSVDGAVYSKDGKVLCCWPRGKPVAIPEGVEEIGPYACYELTEIGNGSITIPDSVVAIGERSFAYCSATSLIMGASVAFVDNYAFLGSYRLCSVVIPPSVSEIRQGVFRNCRLLSSVCFLGDAPAWEGSPYWNSARVVTYVREGTDGWGEVPGMWPDCGCSADEEPRPIAYWDGTNVPFRVTFDLGEEAERTGGGELVQTVFAGGNAEEPTFSIVEPNVTFYGWSEPFTNVMHGVMARAIYKTDGQLPDGQGYRETVDGLTWSFDVLDEAAYVVFEYDEGSGTIQSGVWPSPTGAVTVPDTLGGLPVRGISDLALYGNAEMTELSLPSGLEEFNPGAVSGCEALAAVHVDADSESFTSMGGVLYDKNIETLLCCPSGLTTLVVPASVTSVSAEAFSYGMSMDITFEGAPPEGLQYTWLDRNSVIRYSADYADEWAEVVKAGGFTDARLVDCGELEDYVEKIDGIAWRFCVVDGLSHVGGGALKAVDVETRGALVVPDKLGGCPVVEVSNFAFEGCGYVTSVTIPATVSDIGIEAFRKCVNLREIVFLGDEPLEVGEDAFKWVPSDCQIKVTRAADWPAASIPGTWNGFAISYVPYCNPDIVVVADKAGCVEFSIETILTLSAGAGQAVYYTTDGSEPTDQSNLYSEPLTITETGAISYFAVDGDTGDWSPTTSVSFRRVAAEDTSIAVTPSIEDGATFVEAQEVELEAAEGRTIWYTTDGTDPRTSSRRMWYDGPIVMTGSTTLKYYAVNDATGDWGTVETCSYERIYDPTGVENVIVHASIVQNTDPVDGTITLTYDVAGSDEAEDVRINMDIFGERIVEPGEDVWDGGWYLVAGDRSAKAGHHELVLFPLALENGWSVEGDYDVELWIETLPDEDGYSELTHYFEQNEPLALAYRDFSIDVDIAGYNDCGLIGETRRYIVNLDRDAEAEVALYPHEGGREIHYTTDGSMPTAFSPLWDDGDSGAFGSDTTVRFVVTDVESGMSSLAGALDIVIVRRVDEGGINWQTEAIDEVRGTVEVIGSEESLPKLAKGRFAIDQQAVDGAIVGLGDGLFRGCGRLTEMVLPPNLKTIGEGTFERCTRMTKITLPDGLTSIGDSAFRECASLTDITIPASVTNIGYFAFRDCLRLTNVTLLGKAPRQDLGVYMGVPAFTVVSGILGAATAIVYAEITNKTDEITVPEAWLEELAVAHGTPAGADSYEAAFRAKFGDDFKSALTKPTGKHDLAGNPLQVWQDYVAGTDPLDEEDVFRATVEIVDGVPVVRWNPELMPEQAQRRKYTTWGATALGGGWTDISGLSDAERQAQGYQFFKVSVELK